MTDIDDFWLYSEKETNSKDTANKEITYEEATGKEIATEESTDETQPAKGQESAPLLNSGDTQDASTSVTRVDETGNGLEEEEPLGGTLLENAVYADESLGLQGDEQAEKEVKKDEVEEDNINVVIGNVETNSYANTSQDGIETQPPDNIQEEEKKNTSQNLETVVTLVNNTTGELGTEDADKAWRKPGADISDYFNFGFNEEIWRAYCERQRRMRIHESGTGLSFLKLSGSHSNHSSRHQNVINVIGGDVNRYQGADNMANQMMTTGPSNYGGNLPTFTHDVSVPPPMIPPYGIMTNMLPPLYPPQYLASVGGYYPEINPCYPPFDLPPDSQWFDQGNPEMMMGGYSGNIQMEDERHRSWDRGRSEYGRKYGYDRERTYDRDRGYRDRSYDRDRERDREHRHRERSHRRRSRSRSHERRSRKRRSRSRSQSSAYRTKKKSRKSEKSSSSSSG